MLRAAESKVNCGVCRPLALTWGAVGEAALTGGEPDSFAGAAACSGAVMTVADAGRAVGVVGMRGTGTTGAGD
ncbi:protein of unknown function (plasmid) [Pararobbsia alpina]